ncbi:MAG: putative Ig domain-containing protein [Thermodesulfobacteriota bacterium]
MPRSGLVCRLLLALLVTVAILLPAPAGAVIDHRSAPGDRPHVPGELLVKYHQKLPKKDQEKKRRQKGLTRIRGLKRLGVERVRLAPGVDVRTALAELRQDPEIEYAEPNYLVHALEVIPDDPLFPELWGLRNSGQTGGTAGRDIRATGAWSVETGDPGVIVAVIDTGIDIGHEDLAANLWTNDREAEGDANGDGCPGLCGVDDDGDGLVDEDRAEQSRFLAGGVTPNPAWQNDLKDDDDENGYADDLHGINAITGTGDLMDDHGHGTHCAGTIGAAGNNGLGVTGVNWQVRLLGCKFLGQDGYGAISDAEECMEYVLAMAEREPVVATSNSWGGGGASASFQAMIGLHQEQGILFIAAAGNDAHDLEARPDWPASYDNPNVLTVAALDHDDQLAWFSNHGRRSVDVGAPGVNILSSVPQLSGLLSDPSGYRHLSGTSMATPHVAGLAALLAAASPRIAGTCSLPGLAAAGACAAAGGSWTPAPAGCSDGISLTPAECAAARGVWTEAGQLGWLAIRNRILATGDPTPALAGRSVTGRRVNAANALVCPEDPVHAVLDVPAAPVAGRQYALSALSLSCGAATGEVTVLTAGGSAIGLADDGQGGDALAGDGVFTGLFTATSSSERFDFVFSDQGSTVAFETIVSPPFSLATDRLFHLPAGQPANLEILASGGRTPYTWTITAGRLPDGLSLAGSSSRASISGIPTRPGTFPFTVTVGEGFGTVVSREYTLTVYQDLAMPLLERTLSPAGMSQINDLVVDAAGNRYLAGCQETDTGLDWQVVKLDSAGQVLWQDRYNGPVGKSECAEGLALAPDGSVLVAGWQDLQAYSRQLLVRKHDPAGRLQWAYASSPGVQDFGHGIAVDATGAAYVAGTLAGNLALIKLAGDGVLAWQQTLDSAGLEDQGFGVALDGQGGVWVTGRAANGNTGADLLVARLDTGGVLQWSQTYDGDGNEYGLAIAIDRWGDAYATGYQTRGAVADLLTVKLSAAGQVLWAATYDSGGNDMAMDVAAGSDDAVLVAGKSGSSRGEDLFLLAYDRDGQLLGGQRRDLAGYDETATALCEDRTGRLQVAAAGPYAHLLTFDRQPGVLEMTGLPLPAGTAGAGYQHTLTARYGQPPYTWQLAGGSLPAGLSLDPDSGRLAGTLPSAAAGTSSSFQVTVTDAAGATAQAALVIPVAMHAELLGTFLPGESTGLVVDAGGALYVAGAVTSQSHGAVTRLAADGSVLWTTVVPMGASSRLTDLALDPEGHVVAVGGSDSDFLVVKLDPSGQVLWSRPLLPRPGGVLSPGLRGVAVDGEGNIYAVGSALGAAGGEALTVKLDRDGNELWRDLRPGLGNDLALDPGGAVIVVGTAFGTGRILLSRFAPDGSCLWSRRSFVAEARNVAVAPSGEIGVAGRTRYGGHFFLAGFDASGQLRWDYFAGSSDNGDPFRAVAADDRGRLFFSDSSVAAALAAGDGSRQWQADAAGQIPQAMALDSCGNGYVLYRSYSWYGIRKYANQGPRIAPPALAAISAGQPWQASLTVGCGSAAVLWQVVAGALPPGLTLDPASGRITGQCATVGTYRMVIEARDAHGLADHLELDLTVVYPPPTALNQTLVLAEDTPIQGELLAEDPSGLPLTFAVTGQASHGTVILDDAATGAFTYTPAPDFSGSDSFQVQADNGFGLSNPAFVSLEVTPVNDPPVFRGGPATVAKVGHPFQSKVAATDVDGDPLVFAAANLPAWATLAADSGLLSGAPGMADLGTTAGIVITVSDGQATATLPAFDLRVAAVETAWRQTGVSSLFAPRGVAVAPQGNVVLAGGSGLEKYAPSGQRLWALPADYLTGVDIDSAGNIVTVATTASGQIETSKRDPDGGVLWQALYGPAGGGFMGFAVRVDRAGNVYAGGASHNGVDADALVLKYSPDGAGLWATTHDSGGSDLVLALAVDQAGTVVATGTAGAGSAEQAILTMSCDEAGRQQWSHQARVGTWGGPQGNAVVTDGAGHVYVAAQQYNLSSAPPWLLKYDAQGQLLWARDYSQETGEGPFYGLTMDPAGNLLALGAYNRYDLALAMLDSEGTMAWLAFYDGGDWDYPAALALDGCAVYLAGRSVVAGAWQPLLVKYALVASVPQTQDDAWTTLEDQAVAGVLTAADSGCPAPAFRLVADGLLGHAEITDPATGACTYTPNPGATGHDQFTFVADNGLVSNVGTVQVTVTAANRAPAISGTPGISARVNEPYAFTPLASDPDGDALAFSIANRPAWASFDPATGTLAGTPTTSQASITRGIVITVTDGQLTATMPAFDLAVTTIAVTRARYQSRTLSVRATSAYGADAALTVAGFGPMTWNASQGRWELTVRSLSATAAPATVTVAGPEGTASRAVQWGGD